MGIQNLLKGIKDLLLSRGTKRVLTPKTRLLDVYLSAMPNGTQKQQKARFASVKMNFEFGLWVPMRTAEQLAGQAMQKGFTVWGNIDSTSAFLYGAGMVNQDKGAEMINWLRSISVSGQKVQVAIHNAGEPMKMIEISI